LRCEGATPRERKSRAIARLFAGKGVPCYTETWRATSLYAGPGETAKWFPHQEIQNMKPVFLFVLILGLIILANAKSPDLILKSANSNVNTMTRDGEMISDLNGNVVFLYDDAVIKSDNAKWWKSRGTVSFIDHVVIERTTQRISSEKMDYDKGKKWLFAQGNLDFYDTKERVKLTGDHGNYYLDKKFLVVEGKPRFIFYDTTAHDTLDITGEKMTYDDSLKKASVYDNVTIRKGKLFTHSNTAFYYPDSGRAELRAAPRIAYVTDSLSGDSVDLLFTKKHLQRVKVKGGSHGQYKDFGASDTTLTHLFGDSLSMFLTDSGKIDSMWAVGNVKSRYFPLKSPLQTNEVYGKMMTVSFNSRSEVSRVRVWGNARSIYNVEEKGGRGKNEASGDSITVSFAKGKATHVKLSGTVRGFYAPQPQPPVSAASPVSGIQEKEKKTSTKDTLQ
jgi:lipopolysaccharide export system protein LptA